MERWKKRIGMLAALGFLVTGAVVEAAPVPEKAPLNLALVGVTQIGDRTQAWLMEVDNHARQTVSPGELAFGYRVKSVGPERVVLTRGGREFVLRLDERRVPAVASTPVRTAAPTVSGRIALPRERRALPEVFAPPVFLNQAPETTTEVEVTPPAGAEAGDLRATPNEDTRFLPDTYPGYGAPGVYGMPPGYGMVPDYGMVPYGMVPGYGFDPQAAGYPGFAGYPVYPEAAAGSPGAVFGYPGMAPGYPGYFEGMAPDGYYPGGMSPFQYPGGMAPFQNATAWGSPYACYSPYVGNGLDLSAPRWSRQSGRRQNVDPFRGEITVNPQTLRRRARFSFPVQRP